MKTPMQTLREALGALDEARKAVADHRNERPGAYEWAMHHNEIVAVVYKATDALISAARAVCESDAEGAIERPVADLIRDYTSGNTRVIPTGQQAVADATVLAREIEAIHLLHENVVNKRMTAPHIGRAQTSCVIGSGGFLSAPTATALCVKLGIEVGGSR